MNTVNVVSTKDTHKRKTSKGNSCFSCFMRASVDDKDPTSTGVHLDQNAYNNMSKFGNMSNPKKNDAHESHRDANESNACEKPTEDPTSELAEEAPVVEKSAARSVRSEPPPLLPPPAAEFR